MERKKLDVDPETEIAEDAEENAAPEAPLDIETNHVTEEEPAAEEVATGAAAIQRFHKLAPSTPGVYRMLDAKSTVLYVGKAKNISKRVASYTRGHGHTNRISRMIAQTVSMEFVSTVTETEALLLEANLIKRFAPRFNVLLRDDKSFPYILITRDHAAPQILKHRGARNRDGDYYGPFAAAGAVNRTLNALERAFLLRSCSNAFYESRTRPCLLFQIKRCSAPCTGEIALDEYNHLVSEARDFLSGRSMAVKEMLAVEMEKSAAVLDFERAAALRDRLEALSTIQSHQGVHPRSTANADIFAVHQQGGVTCIEVFFIRNYQNWGDRAYYPRADRTLEAAEVLEGFLPQFYENRIAPASVLLSHEIGDQALLAEALSTRADFKVEVAVPRRGEKRELVEHALMNARAALGRRLAESSSQQRLLKGLTETFGLQAPPRRIEVYDNSHIQGSNPVGVMIVAGRDGFEKGQYRKFNIKDDIAPGDDMAMMREVLRRRFKRLQEETPRPETNEADSPWPDLVILDGGPTQLAAARQTLKELGIDNVPMLGVAKGVDRDAGRETFHIQGREPFRLPPRDPVLYFVERLRDEAHRFAVGSHRGRRKKDIATLGLQEIPGVGPTRKRALLRHFGTLATVENASVTDLQKVPGISAATAQAIYDFFHANG